jgi:hypothetical protein
MGFFDWLFAREKSKGVAAEPCVFCHDPIAAKWSLDDLGVPGPKDCYLLRCPKCGRFWGGYACTPQILYELTLDEVKRDFPSAVF